MLSLTRTDPLVRKKLIDNEAVCTFVVGERTFGFTDVGDVQRGLDRLGQENLHEDTLSLQGVFQGALPKRRTFEFQIADTGQVISGRFGPSISDAGELNSHLGQLVTIELTAMKLGQGRPRYVLNQMPAWQQA